MTTCRPTSKWPLGWTLLGLVLAVLIVAYLAGYAVIRADCKRMAGELYTLPAQFSADSSKVLFALYRPLFIADQYCTGRIVIWKMETDDPGHSEHLFPPRARRP